MDGKRSYRFCWMWNLGFGFDEMTITGVGNYKTSIITIYVPFGKIITVKQISTAKTPASIWRQKHPNYNF